MRPCRTKCKHLTRVRGLLAIALFSTVPTVAFCTSAPRSPIGNWRALDNKSHKPLAVVEVYRQHDEFYGKIIKTFAPKQPDTRLCTACPGDRKNAPIIGLRVLEHIKIVNGKLRGGTILNPQSGKEYRCGLALQDDGRKMVVHAFVGLSLFGRNQTWVREP